MSPLAEAAPAAGAALDQVAIATAATTPVTVAMLALATSSRRSSSRRWR